jgi:Lrp/AsnC family leucine-responsive transcriptional regulator
MRNKDQGVLINNKTDLKLIAELQKDGSVSYSDLGARLGITPRTVAKRVEGLIESKLITIRAQPNPYKLNLSASAVVAIKADPTKIDHICDLLSGHFHVNLVQTVFGRLDILIIVYFSRWAQLHHFIRNELYTIDGITHAEFYFVEEVYKRYDRFFEKEPFPNGRVKLKETDWTLIKELAKDGCTKPVVLAEKLGIRPGQRGLYQNQRGPKPFQAGLFGKRLYHTGCGPEGSKKHMQQSLFVSGGLFHLDPKQPVGHDCLCSYEGYRNAV